MRVGKPLSASIEIGDFFDGRERTISISGKLPFAGERIEVRIQLATWDGVKTLTATPSSAEVELKLVCGRTCAWSLSNVATEDVPKVEGPLALIEASVWYKTSVGSFLLAFAQKVFGQPSVLIEKGKISIGSPGGILTVPKICAGENPSSLECKEGWSSPFSLRTPKIVAVYSNGKLVYCWSGSECWKIGSRVFSSCSYVQCSDCGEDLVQEARDLWPLLPNACLGDPVALKELEEGLGIGEEAISVSCPVKPLPKFIEEICYVKQVECVPPLSEVPPSCRCVNSEKCGEVSESSGLVNYQLVLLLFFIGTMYAIHLSSRSS